MKKPLAVLIANPAARKATSRKIEMAASLIRERGYGLEILLTEAPGDGTGLARSAAAGMAPAIVLAAGGDGALNEVMNGLAGTDVPMGMLPMGTTNVLAKELGVPETVSGAVERALSGATHRVSLGRVTPEGSEGRLFFLMAGVGFDAKAVLGMNRTIKKYSGKAAYVLSGMRVLLGWDPAELDVSVDGEGHTAYSVIVCNSAKYGGHMKAAPDADIEKPSLQAVLLHGRRRTDLLRYAAGVLAGRHAGMRDVTIAECRRVEVRGGPAHIQMDGDYLGQSPAVIESVPDSLSLVY